MSIYLKYDSKHASKGGFGHCSCDYFTAVILSKMFNLEYIHYKMIVNDQFNRCVDWEKFYNFSDNFRTYEQFIEDRTDRIEVNVDHKSPFFSKYDYDELFKIFANNDISYNNCNKVIKSNNKDSIVYKPQLLRVNVTDLCVRLKLDIDMSSPGILILNTGFENCLEYSANKGKILLDISSNIKCDKFKIIARNTGSIKINMFSMEISSNDVVFSLENNNRIYMNEVTMWENEGLIPRSIYDNVINVIRKGIENDITRTKDVVKVGIHIRAGDWVPEPLSYYVKAIQNIDKIIGNVPKEYYVYSFSLKICNKFKKRTPDMIKNELSKIGIRNINYMSNEVDDLTVKHMITNNILVGGYSAFFRISGYLFDGLKIYLPVINNDDLCPGKTKNINFKDFNKCMLERTDQWLPIDINGFFDENKLKLFLEHI